MVDQTFPLLDSLTCPQDLRDLPDSEVDALCQEIRRRIIEVMAVNGGHLASNLGVVELTVALHRAFKCPEDHFIWDVSHQTYPHKLVTGRHPRFDGVRQYEGLSGFSNPLESPFDHFHGGHAGVALSQALGVATTRDLCGEDFHVVPIIGDATLTCGMAFEALNNLKKDLRRFVVILNDNRMSISKNVGNITQILSRILNSATGHKISQDFHNWLARIPSCGEFLAEKGDQLSASLKNLVSPALFFEQWGLHYMGPFDGHDVPKLTQALAKAKDADYPVVLHVLTNKGQGIELAVQNPTTYHGVKPFDKDTYKFLPSKGSKTSFPKVFGKHLLRMGEEDPDLLAVTPAMPHGSCLTGFMERYPERCLDVGIAESHSITFAASLAYGGKKKVIASIYSTFLQRALDNLFHDVCLQEIPLVIAIDRAGVSGGDGVMANGVFDISFLNVMPGMVICQPRNGHLLKELMSSAFDWKRPTAIRYPNLPTEEFDAVVKKRALGKGEILAEGEDLLIIALGNLCDTALEVRRQLAEHGIQPTVFDPVFVKPLDADRLHELLRSHKQVLTLEEHSVRGGLGSIFNSWTLENGYRDLKVLNLGIPDEFVYQGNHGKLMASLGLSPEGITQRLLQHFGEPSKVEEKALSV